MQTLWIKFMGPRTELVCLHYNEREQKRFATFEEFKQNYIRGWGRNGDDPATDEPVGWLVQDERPLPDAKFNSEYAEFVNS